MSNTPRQRVLNALNFKEGAVPVDFGGHRSSGISAIAYARLKQALGIVRGEIYVYDVMGQLALVEPEVLDAVGGDTLDWAHAFLRDPKQWSDWTLPDGTPCKVPAYLDLREDGSDRCIHNMRTGARRAVQVKGSLSFERVDHPFANYDLESGVDPVFEAWADGSMDGAPPPGSETVFAPGNAAPFAAKVRALRAESDRAILGIFGGSLFEVTHWLFGMENDFMQMSAFPDEYEALVARVGEEQTRRLAVWLDAFGESVDCVVFADDYGGQQGPLISPEMYRRYFKPVHKRMWEMVHARSRAKVNLHCCGGIAPILPDMEEIGLDALNPVQFTCAGMDVADLKRRYGGKITLWGGGCDTRDILMNATPEKVAEHVLRQCAILSPGGGFVFQQVHNIMSNVPVRNMIAMFDAVKAFNRGRPGS